MFIVLGFVLPTVSGLALDLGICSKPLANQEYPNYQMMELVGLMFPKMLMLSRYPLAPLNTRLVMCRLTMTLL